MPFAENDGIRIHYEVEGSGPPLVLHHGFGCFIETWYGWGYVEPLKQKYQLILMDSRGSGKSDRPHDPGEYALSKRVADVVAVLDAAGVETAHFFGYSMGAYIGWGIPKFAPERFRSLVLGGGGPIDEGQVDTSTKPNAAQLQLRMGMDIWVQRMMLVSGDLWVPEWEAICRAEDLTALEVMAGAWESVSYEQVLSKMTLPCMILAGTEDHTYASAYAVSRVSANAEFVALEGLNHLTGLLRTDVTIPHIMRFIDNIEQGM